MNFDFYFPTEIITGQNCVKEQFNKISSLGKKALIVTGKNGARQSGALGHVTEGFNSLNMPYTVFDGVGANPTVEMCEKAREKGKDCDFVVAIGGGSAMDAAKAIAVICAHPELPANSMYDKTLSALPLVCIGTTAGTGSEADCSAVITAENGTKKSFTNPAVFPVYSFCDPSYTLSLSYRQTVATALDAFCHATESLFSTKITGFSEIYSKRAIELIFPYLKKMAENTFDPRDFTARESLLYGSVLAGRAICFAGTGYTHPAGYPFTEKMGLPHGAACALFSADFLKRTGVSRPRLYSWLCDTCQGESTLYSVLSSLTKNNITVSMDFAKAVVDRVMVSGNLARSLCDHSEATVQDIVKPFVDDSQTESVKGNWLLGL